MFSKASLTPVLAAIIIFHHGFFHSSVSFILLLLSLTSFSICPSVTFSTSLLLLCPLFRFLSLIFPSPSRSPRAFSHLPLSHLLALTLLPSLTLSLSLSSWWTQLLLTPLSHKTDRWTDSETREGQRGEDWWRKRERQSEEGGKQS